MPRCTMWPFSPASHPLWYYIFCFHLLHWPQKKNGKLPGRNIHFLLFIENTFITNKDIKLGLIYRLKFLPSWVKTSQKKKFFLWQSSYLIWARDALRVAVEMVFCKSELECKWKTVHCLPKCKISKWHILTKHVCRTYASFFFRLFQAVVLAPYHKLLILMALWWSMYIVFKTDVIVCSLFSCSLSQCCKTVHCLFQTLIVTKVLSCFFPIC